MNTDCLAALFLTCYTSPPWLGVGRGREGVEGSLAQIDMFWK